MITGKNLTVLCIGTSLLKLTWAFLQLLQNLLGLPRPPLTENSEINEGNCYPMLFFWRNPLKMYTPYLIGDRNNNEKPRGKANLGKMYCSIHTAIIQGLALRLLLPYSWLPEEVSPRTEMIGKVTPCWNTTIS